MWGEEVTFSFLDLKQLVAEAEAAGVPDRAPIIIESYYCSEKGFDTAGIEGVVDHGCFKYIEDRRSIYLRCEER